VGAPGRDYHAIYDGRISPFLVTCNAPIRFVDLDHAAQWHRAIYCQLVIVYCHDLAICAGRTRDFGALGPHETPHYIRAIPPSSPYETESQNASAAQLWVAAGILVAEDVGLL
jgi:hypothetical protein